MFYLTSPDRVFILDKAVHTIGRLASNDFAIDHPLVSRQHAILRRIGLIYTIEDLGSLNGTYVNGRRVRNAELQDGMTVRIGQQVEFLFSDRAPETAIGCSPLRYRNDQD